MNRWIFRLGLIGLALAILAGFYLAMREKPILVDTAMVKRGEMQVTIKEEGITQVKDVYTVSAPIAGHLDRTTLEEGASVAAHQTVVARIHPPEPPFLDERTLAEYTAAAEAARSAVALAEVEHARAEKSLDLARSEYNRASQLAKTNVVSERALEQAYNDLQLQEAQVASTEAVISLRKAELASALARLRQPRDINAAASGVDCCIELTSPVDGVILKVLARSEQAVAQGAPIIEIGDPTKLEIVVDLQSSDAPRVQPGSRAIISDWGGDTDLSATVRRIDPAAFTQVSSLGIEEQRVNVILDLDTVRPELGHGYRVLASLVVWSADDVLQIPIGALFRSGGEWAAFAVSDGRAELRRIEIGRINDEFAQITGGLDEGDTVILYPNDVLQDGSLVEPR
jgi:HlyD family secretion protein